MPRSSLVRELSARHVVAVAVLLAGTAAVLAAMGRPWWCKTGDMVPWSGEVWSRHNSQHLGDPYTVTHVMHGVLLHAALWAVARRVASPITRAAVAFGIEAAWEIIENTDAMIERYRATTISLDYYGDSVANSLGDIVAFLAGYVAASLAPVWLSASGFVLAELVLLITIRDGLVLNVLMLVYPIESVKRWQMGGTP